jgi:hypothetical protein
MIWLNLAGILGLALFLLYLDRRAAHRAAELSKQLTVITFDLVQLRTKLGS